MVEQSRARSFPMRRVARIVSVVFLGLFSLAGCVGLSPGDRLILSDGAAITITHDATCSTSWSTDQEHSESTSEIDPAGFRLMTWNLYKVQKPGWRRDFARLTKDRDLVLLQEANLTPLFRYALEEGRYHWAMAHAFDYKGAESGVLTAGKVRPTATCLERIPEPLIRIPKSGLVSRYPLGGSSEELWVANLHGVNFTLGTGQFRNQLESLAAVLAQHRGPLILAGDFNNWSPGRNGVLDRVTGRLQLELLELSEDNRSRHLGRPVDHVFFRGVEVIEANSVEVSSSDHNPILVTLKVPGYAGEGNDR